MKHSLTFTIRGNHEDPLGNPIPYTRATQGSKFNARYKRYLGWKSFVAARYLDSQGWLKEMPKTEDWGDIHDQLERKPIQRKMHARVTVEIAFGNETHSDPDNVVKGILDALFEDDKHVDVSTHHTCRNANPQVHVMLEWEDDGLEKPSHIQLPSLHKATAR